MNWYVYTILSTEAGEEQGTRECSFFLRPLRPLAKPPMPLQVVPGPQLLSDMFGVAMVEVGVDSGT